MLQEQKNPRYWSKLWAHHWALIILFSLLNNAKLSHILIEDPQYSHKPSYLQINAHICEHVHSYICILSITSSILTARQLMYTPMLYFSIHAIVICLVLISPSLHLAPSAHLPIQTLLCIHIHIYVYTLLLLFIIHSLHDLLYKALA